jgi:hypothetical protein
VVASGVFAATFSEVVGVRFMTMLCDINFEVRQIMYQIVNGLQRRRHFCFDANPYGIARRGLRRNRNVWAAVSSDLSHLPLESKQPNKSRGCVKSAGVKFGNDQIFDMTHFDEVGRRIRWSKNEFSHRLSPEPTAVGAVRSAVAVHIASRRWLSFFR